jgi:hypothetical protein
MKQQHPITPPDELIGEWIDTDEGGLNVISRIATRAAQWGADQELEACCELLDKFNDGFWCDELRAARRPKPLSLKERSLKHLEVMERDRHYLPEILQDLRRAVEMAPDA